MGIGIPTATPKYTQYSGGILKLKMWDLGHAKSGRGETITLHLARSGSTKHNKLKIPEQRHPTGVGGKSRFQCPRISGTTSSEEGD